MEHQQIGEVTPPPSGPYGDLEEHIRWMQPDCSKILVELSSTWQAINSRGQSALARQPEYGEYYSDGVGDGDNELRENLIGVCFVVLQVRITSAIRAFKLFQKCVRDSSQCKPDKDCAIRGLNGCFKGTGLSFVQLVWDLGNYYKHRDEWSWKATSGQEAATRQRIAKIGIKQRGFYDFQEALNFLDCERPEQIKILFKRIEDWESKLLEKARTEVGEFGS